MVAPNVDETDVLLVGAGIFSATLGSMLIRADPGLDIRVLERLEGSAQEASDPWYNAGTGHAGLCELNYTPQGHDGSVDSAQAISIYERFLHSQLFWASLCEEGALAGPRSFINVTPHMGFVYTPEDRAFLKARYRVLKQHHFFASMEYSEEAEQVSRWAPLLMEGRDEAIAATYSAEGTDVDFGSITRQLLNDFEARGGGLHYSEEVRALTENTDGTWAVQTSLADGRGQRTIRAKRVFVGAGGWTLKLLRRAGLREVRGYGLLPVSGTFLVSEQPSVVSRHRVKAYGKAPAGAPPMSMPHLDARVIDGGRSVLFGPFAGAVPKFLREGSPWDLFHSLRADNAWRLAAMGLQNLNLLRLLFRDLSATHKKKVAALQNFMPTAQEADWRLVTAGQRAQIVRPDRKRGGKLTFGTELVSSPSGNIAGVLGASPGASTVVPIAVDVLKRMFPHAMQHRWRRRMGEYLPYLDAPLAEEQAMAARAKEQAHTVLGLGS